MKPDIKVKQGVFRLASVDVLRATSDLLVLSVDCHSKYPDEGIVSRGPEGSPPEVYFFGSVDSRGLDETTEEPTVITLPSYLGREWNIMTDGARYTIRIIAWRDSLRRREVWRDDQQKAEAEKDRALEAERWPSC